MHFSNAGLTGIQMIAHNAVRARLAASPLTRRAFSTTRAQMVGFHYPEGARSSLPFNPLTRFFAFRYWTFCGKTTSQRSEDAFADVCLAVGFGLPFGVAGMILSHLYQTLSPKLISS